MDYHRLALASELFLGYHNCAIRQFAFILQFRIAIEITRRRTNALVRLLAGCMCAALVFLDMKRSINEHM
jgi:hypothetical protein